MDRLISKHWSGFVTISEGVVDKRMLGFIAESWNWNHWIQTFWPNVNVYGVVHCNTEKMGEEITATCVWWKFLWWNISWVSTGLWNFFDLYTLGHYFKLLCNPQNSGQDFERMWHVGPMKLCCMALLSTYIIIPVRLSFSERERERERDGDRERDGLEKLHHCTTRVFANPGNCTKHCLDAWSSTDRLQMWDTSFH